MNGFLGVVKNKKAAKPRIAFFASFLGSKKEVGCGTKSHCCYFFYFLLTITKKYVLI